MLKKVSSEFEKKFILNHIRDEDREELIALYGNNWYRETIKVLKNNNFLVLYGFDEAGNEIPVAMGGFYDFNRPEQQIASVWILSSSYIYINKIKLLSVVKKQLKASQSKYKIMYNYIYKKNFLAKKWLSKLGFKFDKPSPKGLNVKNGFEFFYKVN